MGPSGFLSFLREQVKSWVKQDVGDIIWTEATVVEVKGTLARIQRPGPFSPDMQFYPTISPYQPRSGDKVICIRSNEGLVILGAVNRGGAGETNVGNYAMTDSPVFTGKPTAPTQNKGDFSDAIATTRFVTNNPVLNDAQLMGLFRVARWGTFSTSGSPSRAVEAYTPSGVFLGYVALYTSGTYTPGGS